MCFSLLSYKLCEVMIHVGMLDEECASVLFLLLYLDWHRMSAS